MSCQNLCCVNRYFFTMPVLRGCEICVNFTLNTFHPETLTPCNGFQKADKRFFHPVCVNGRDVSQPFRLPSPYPPLSEKYRKITKLYSNLPCPSEDLSCLSLPIMGE